MKFIGKLIYGIVFIVLAAVAVFLGGVSGVAGTFYLLVEAENVHQSLLMVIAASALLLLLLLMLKRWNRKGIKKHE